MSKPAKILAVAFDMDGLMFNTEDLYLEVARQLLARRGHELDMRMIQKMMGLPVEVAYPIMIDWCGLSESVEKLSGETEDLFAELLPTALAPMPGLLELLDKIEQMQLPKAIATSSNRGQVERILEIAQLPVEFDFWLTSDDVENGKPHPEIYTRTAANFGIKPPQMVVLEDSEHGCRSAVAAQATTVAVPGPHNAHASYEGVAFVAESLADERLHRLVCGSR